MRHNRTALAWRRGRVSLTAGGGLMITEDTFPAGLQIRELCGSPPPPPLGPVDFRSTDACQTEYTPDYPGRDWGKRQIFLQLLDITGANKQGNEFSILNQQNAEVGLISPAFVGPPDQLSLACRATGCRICCFQG